MTFLNYHHLRYFWVIARERNLTRTAKQLNISPSALSTQLRHLEEHLGQKLFDRRSKGMVLSEAGRVAYEYAETIFRTGNELMDTFEGKLRTTRKALRIGAVATLSRNFQLEFIRPAFASDPIEVTLRSGNLRELLVHLRAYTIDLILATEPAASDGSEDLDRYLIAEFDVSLVAAPPLRLPNNPFPYNLHRIPMVLPGWESSLRAPFEALLAASGVRPIVAAEVDDMAMLRLLAREEIGVALVPPVVVKDELRDGRLREICRVPGLTKRFYAVSLKRHFANPLVRQLIDSAARSFLKKAPLDAKAGNAIPDPSKPKSRRR